MLNRWIWRSIVEILQGQEYGNLYYPGTVAEPEQFGTSITNLEDEYGQGITNYSIKYKADGVQPDINSPGIVTIRCSANDIDIAPVEIGFPIKYNEDPPDEGGSIIVNFDKENYRPGEEAQANCKWLTGYDELIEFPSEQRFTVEITGGSEYGTLQDPITGETSNILQEVSNGFRVITATGISEDSVKIILKVSTSVGGDLPTVVITKGGSSEETERSRRKDKQITPEVLVIGGDEIIGYGTVIIKSDDEWCKNLNECDEIEFPDIELKVHENNWEGLDACGEDFIAGTNFFESENSYFREDFDIELCKEEGSNKVQFIIDDDIVINCVSDMCVANINAGQDILIDDVYSFPQNFSCKNKLFWLELHKNYPYPTTIIDPPHIYESVYVIKYIWLRHEEEHIKHFLNVAESFKWQYLIKIKETIKQCSEYGSEEDALSDFKTAAEKIIKQFYDEVKKEDDRISSGGNDNGDIIKFEKDKIHKKVIDDYIQPLIDRWKLTNCID